MASINDFSNITNIPQLQNLQSLITLAQSNPDLLNILTNEAFYGNSSGATHSQPQSPSHSYNTILPAPSTNTSNIALPPLSAAVNSSTSQPPRTINDVTKSISNISNTADALNQDIDDLGISLQALANHLGFDPSKASHTDDKIDDVDDGELLDMDEFLNTYGTKLLFLNFEHFY